MAEFPALPFFSDAYLADTTHLSYEEHGLYLHILLTMWRSPGCRIPADPKWLEKRFKNYANASRTLCEEFCYLSDDGKWWYQKKLLKTWNWCQKRREKATHGAKARWDKEKDQSDSIEQAYASTMRSHTPSNASYPIQSTYKKGQNGNRDSKKEGFRYEPGTPQFCAWKAYASDNRKFGLKRELEQRELEGRGFYFESQWPPDHKTQ